MTESGAQAAAPSPSTVRKVALAAMAGSAIEWYDFFIYLTAAALVFGPLFFPGGSEVAGVLAAFSTAAVGFVARPIGGLLFGHFGDRLGRKPTLVIALLTMGTATTLVGLLPTYQTIGVAAPIALFVLLLAGPRRRRPVGRSGAPRDGVRPRGQAGLLRQLRPDGVPVGLVLGNTIFLVISQLFGEQAFATWAWRIPFLLSVILIGIALYIQLRLEDTPVFRRLEERQQEGEDAESGSPVLEVLRDHPKQILLAAGAFFVVNGAFYVLITGMLDYGTRTLGLSQNVMLAAVLISAAVEAVAIVGMSAVSDRVGRRPVFMAGAALLGLWAFPSSGS